MRLQGHARDVLTSAEGGAPIICAEDRMTATASLLREIIEIGTEPARPAVAGLAGKRAGGHLRGAIDALLPEERARGTPLYLLLDDLAGTSLVAPWAWSLWHDDWLARLYEIGRTQKSGPSAAGRTVVMEGVCIGFAPGSSALRAGSYAQPEQNSVAVPPLVHPDDPAGWHALPVQTGAGMRRARRIDVWLEKGHIHIDAGFQDSATTPAGGRAGIHEYALKAVADPGTGTLLSVTADPRVLPHVECPAAIGNIGRLVGTRLTELRRTVLDELRGTAGCTHLNDALRALAEVPQLSGALQTA